MYLAVSRAVRHTGAGRTDPGLMGLHNAEPALAAYPLGTPWAGPSCTGGHIASPAPGPNAPWAFSAALLGTGRVAEALSCH